MKICVCCSASFPDEVLSLAKEIEALGQEFDPNWMQAMMTEQVEGVEAGKVTAVLQKGYKLKDRLLRAAMVKVSE
jgi:molecular chaperone GrpE